MPNKPRQKERADRFAEYTAEQLETIRQALSMYAAELAVIVAAMRESAIQSIGVDGAAGIKASVDLVGLFPAKARIALQKRRNELG